MSERKSLKEQIAEKKSVKAAKKEEARIRAQKIAEEMARANRQRFEMYHERVDRIVFSAFDNEVMKTIKGYYEEKKEKLIDKLLMPFARKRK